jgi:hypothetical protein
MKPILFLALISLFCLSLSQPLLILAMPRDQYGSDVLQSKKADYLIARGRVGKISKSTNKQKLASIFKLAELEDFTAHGAEGEGDYPATMVTLDGKRVLDVLWKDNSRQQVSSVRIYDGRWHTAEGVAVDVSVSKLQKLFGKFEFYGFDWDYGGTVLSSNSKLYRYRQNLGLDFQVGLPIGTCEIRSQDCASVIGEKNISSANQAIGRLKAKVVTMTVSF